MRFAFVYSSREDLLAGIPGEQVGAAYGALAGWFEEHDEAFIGCGAQLQPPTEAVTVRSGEGGEPGSSDGPSSPGAESLLGFSLMEAPDADAALVIARSWPLLALPGCAIEVRPVVVD